MVVDSRGNHARIGWWWGEVLGVSKHSFLVWNRQLLLVSQVYSHQNPHPWGKETEAEAGQREVCWGPQGLPLLLEVGV